MTKQPVLFGRLAKDKIFTGKINGESQIFFKFWRGIISIDTGKFVYATTIMSIRKYHNARLLLNKANSFLRITIDPPQIPIGMIFTGRIEEYQERIFIKSDHVIIALDSCDSWALSASDIQDYREYPSAEIKLK